MSSLLFLAVPLAVMAVFLLVGGILLAVALNKKVEQPGGRAVGPGPARWNVQVLGDGPMGGLGGSIGSHFGVLEVAHGQLSFVPADGGPQGWRVPCPAVRARKRGMLNLDGADLELTGPMGVVRCSVSEEHINRVMTNDFKSFRERGYADHFLAVAAAHGAQVER